MLGDNIKVDNSTLTFIRSLEDFDLIMLLSEINDHGWAKAQEIIPNMQRSIEAKRTLN